MDKSLKGMYIKYYVYNEGQELKIWDLLSQQVEEERGIRVNRKANSVFKLRKENC